MVTTGSETTSEIFLLPFSCPAASETSQEVSCTHHSGGSVDIEQPSAEVESRAEARDELIKAALVSRHSYEEAGEAAGVSARTVRRRMADPAFAQDVRARRAERASALSGGLLDLGAKCLEVLSDALEDEDPGTRLRAAQAVLTLGQRFRREGEMTDRIARVEGRLDELALARRTGKGLPGAVA